MSQLIDILVVGTGPVGLASALALAQNGLTIRVIEKLDGPAVGQRGAGIMARTLEAYHFLGVLGDIKKSGGSWFTTIQYDENGKAQREFNFMATKEPTPDMPETNAMMLGQDDACAILRNHLKQYGVTVEYSTELVGIRDDEADDLVATVKIQGNREEQILARFIIGADGAKGAARKLKGIPFIGQTRDEFKMLIGDVILHGILETHWHFFKSADSKTMMLRPTDHPGLFFIAVERAHDDFSRLIAEPEYLLQTIRDISKHPEIELGEIKALAEWRPNIRMVDEFRAGRVFLAGDAAHVHSPTGGQGMNSGFMDAMNLSWKLALVCKGLAPQALLDTYSEERVPVIREMLQVTTGLLNKTIARDDEAFKRSRTLHQLGMHYRWSSIVRDEFLESSEDKQARERSAYAGAEPGQLYAGDRAPDAPELLDAQGNSRRLFDIFKPTYHTAIVFDPTLASSSLAQQYPTGTVRVVYIAADSQSIATSPAEVALYDSKGYARGAYRVEHGVKAAVVRPDGVVGALLRNEDGIAAYFNRIFRS